MGNYHVRFCSGSGAGDRPTDPQLTRPAYGGRVSGPKFAKLGYNESKLRLAETAGG